MITKHKLPSGIALTLRQPKSRKPCPVVVLCHGFCGVQEILIPPFADYFTQAGFCTVTFDNRGFGNSEGERGRLVPAMQIADILAVVEWLKAQPSIDTSGIGLWGTSLGGCHVLSAAAENPDIKCIVSQMGFADGEELVTSNMTPQEKSDFLAMLDKLEAKKETTGKEMFVSVTRVLSDDESKAFFENNKAEYPAIDIKIPFLTVRETVRYKPVEYAKRVTSPTLICLAEKDKVNPPEQGRKLFDSIRSTQKQLYIGKGARHFEMYSGIHFETVAAEQLHWFELYLAA